jgi:purine-binding chemotaxis protein CheW
MDHTFKQQEKSLGQLLIQAGMITKEQLMEALREQGESGEPVGKILVKKRFVTEQDIMAALKGMLVVVFELNSEKFAIEVIYSKEILVYRRVTPLPSVPEHVAGIINIREKVVPVLSLNKMIFSKTDPLSEDTRIIVMEVKGETIGILVDNVLQVRNFDTANFENISKYSFAIDRKYIAGVIKDGAEIITLIKPEILSAAG